MDPQITAFLNIIDKPIYGIAFGLLALWALCWKGVALWKSARHGQKKWFIALLILNTFSILEIIYIFYFQKKADNIQA